MDGGIGECIGSCLDFGVEENREQGERKSRSWEGGPVFIYGSGGAGVLE